MVMSWMTLVGMKCRFTIYLLRYIKQVLNNNKQDTMVVWSVAFTGGVSAVNEVV